MRRRELLAGLGFLLTAPAAAQVKRPVRIGVVRPGLRPPDDDIQVVGLVQALREFGHVNGRGILVDNRYADNDVERLQSIIVELLRDGADILVPVGVTATLASREATKIKPIIAFANVDPVAAGLVDRLGRPNGNVTGVLVAPQGTLAAKRLSLLREAVPHVRRVALLAPEGDPAFELQIKETQEAAAAAGINLAVVRDGRQDYVAAFARISEVDAKALVVGSHQFYVRDRREIIALAEHHQLPAIYEWRQQVEDGGLMSFGANLMERYRRLAHYVDRIIKGAKPSDLPFEQPAELRLVVNLKAARTIGLELPPNFLARADEVIE